MWNATLYDKMSKERLQPSLDLVSRIADRQFDRIIDIGCGTGLSTTPLKKNWPDAEITGVDLSDEMLGKARHQLKDVTWYKRDCSSPLDDLGTFDLVFSNAFLQWLKNQKEFLENTHRLLNENGILAIQLPDFQNMAASDCINAVAAEYGSVFESMAIYHNFAIEEYYDLLITNYSFAEVWRTSYYHLLTDHKAILEFIRTTALRPFLARLASDDQDLFLARVLDALKRSYLVRPDGCVLFEFKRMFLLAQK
ncbi:MAG: trans-aconitate 2-methyltransferase [Eubacteriaceae bacterium]|jgi:trans-aconitate 2-methyltransferase|nr:trans-aconitate 2-methyltransferase [Acetobacterium sp.]MDN5308424.1 trans-aconitate 2-methyltransferase [Eubacteriaceae bacterium]